MLLVSDEHRILSKYFLSFSSATEPAAFNTRLSHLDNLQDNFQFQNKVKVCGIGGAQVMLRNFIFVFFFVCRFTFKS
jgi:hypothetical protein